MFFYILTSLPSYVTSTSLLTKKLEAFCFLSTLLQKASNHLLTFLLRSDDDFKLMQPIKQRKMSIVVLYDYG